MKFTHTPTILLLALFLAYTASAQKVTESFVTESILGESVAVKTANSKWTFVPDEPLKVTVLKQKWVGKTIVSTAWIKTSDVEGTQKLEGRIKLTFTEGDGGLELTSIEDDGLRFTSPTASMPVYSPPTYNPPPVRRPVILAAGTNSIGGRQWRVWSFTIGNDGVDRVRGWFSGPNGGVQGLILTASEYENWKAGGTYFPNYASGNMKVGNVNVRLRPGNYVFVAFNPNVITSQAVRVELAIVE